MELVIKNGTLVTEEGIVNEDLRLEQGKIVEIRPNLVPSPGATVIDASGLIVLPGVIDAHTHYSLVVRGACTADDFVSGSRSAACGGVTTFIDYADPIEGKSLAQAMEQRRREAEGNACIDYHLHMCLYGHRSWTKEELLELKNAGVRNLKVFTTYDNMQIPDQNLEKLLVDCKELDMLVTVHAEDQELVAELAGKFKVQGKVEPEYHGQSRPNECERKAIANVIAMAEKHGTPVYFVHVSTAQGAELIREAKSRGLMVFGETCPHYLVLTEECFQRDFPKQYIMTPPLRSAQDNLRLWEALQQGDLQVVATDHCAYTLEQKKLGKTCFTTLPGIPGSETLLPLLFSEGIDRDRLTLEQLAAYLATNPAKLFGLYPQKGVIREGSDGDLVIVDPNLEKTLSGEMLHSKAGYTPFHDIKVKGYPVITVSRGKVIYRDNDFVGEPGWGQFVQANRITWI